MTETGTDLEPTFSDSAMTTLVQNDDEKFVEWASGMEKEEYFDIGYALAHMSRTSAIRAGWTAYQIRTMTPDGEWGQEVYRMAEFWEVSERTIHRWMKTAQETFGFELTAAQKNAAVAPPPTDRREGGPADGVSEEWAAEHDDENPFAGIDTGDGGPGGEGGYWGWDPEQGKDVWMTDDETPPDSRSLLDRMNDEAGWGEGTLPSADYVNPPDSPRPGVAPVLPPDPTWVAFVAQQIQAEHPGYEDLQAQRSATARWSRKIEDEPLDLLEELELIHDAAGSSVPDATAEALHAAEEAKAIKPDEVTEGKKKKRGPAGRKLAYDQAEKLLQLTRQLMEHVSTGMKAGTVSDKEAAAMLPHLTAIPYTLGELKKRAQEAKDRYLATNPPMDERIAATQATDPGTEDY